MQLRIACGLPPCICPSPDRAWGVEAWADRLDWTRSLLRFDALNKDGKRDSRLTRGKVEMRFPAFVPSLFNGSLFDVADGGLDSRQEAAGSNRAFDSFQITVEGAVAGERADIFADVAIGGLDAL